MKVITVRQPWAWAIMHGGKNVENRSRNIAGSYRGRIAIHAALADAPEAFDANALMQGQRGRRFEHGAILGTVELVDVHHDSDTMTCVDYEHGPTDAGLYLSCSPWAMDDRWHLVLRDPQPFDKPIPAKGRLGLWNWDGAIA